MLDDSRQRPLGPCSFFRTPIVRKHTVLWQPFLKYISNIVWDKDEVNTPGVFFLETVFDFELTSGLEITHPKIW